MSDTVLLTGATALCLVPALRWLSDWAPWAIDAQDAEDADQEAPARPEGFLSQYRRPFRSDGWMWDALAVALAIASAAWHGGPEGLAYAGLAIVLVVLARVDAKTKYLPDSLTQIVLWSGLIAAAAGVTVSPGAAIFGAALGYGFPWLIYQGYRLVRGVEGMGFGDFKLLAGLGAWAGWTSVPYMILVAAVLGCMVYGIQILRDRADAQDEFAFGPYIAAAGWIWITAGSEIQRFAGL